MPEGPSSEKRDLPLVCRIEATEPDRFAQLCRALRLDETGLTLSQRDRLASVLKTYSNVFALNNEELGTTSVVEHSINTGDAEPVRQYARRVPYAMRDKLTELVERLHRTLLDMLSKSTGDNKKAWDTKLPFILFAYRATQQDSTKSSPFQLLYGREVELPTADMLTPPSDRTLYPTDGYHDEIVGRMSSAWDITRSQITRAQCKQKKQYDKRASCVGSSIAVGDVVYVFMPARKTGEERKLSSPHDGPYRVTEIWSTGAEVMRLGRRKSKPMRIALDRLRKCPEELVAAAGLSNTVCQSDPDSVAHTSGDGPAPTTMSSNAMRSTGPPTSGDQELRPMPWRGRLRAQRGHSDLGEGGVTSTGTLTPISPPLHHQHPPCLSCDAMVTRSSQ